MNAVLITGSAGLIGSEAARFFAAKGFHIVGIDNDSRRDFFGPAASTAQTRQALESDLPEYDHIDADIRDETAVRRIFSDYGTDLKAVIHAAAQPSHDWSASDPSTDFSVNATATVALLEATRRYCSDACFIFTSTNKVYGEHPNQIPLVEMDSRWEPEQSHRFSSHGIDESMSVDFSRRSPFGASKLAADVMVQEYGKYFGMKTACFRCGCVTGPGHAGAMLHGFLAYLVKCAVRSTPYTIFGYGGKQVRDNIHSYDLVNMFWHFFQQPQVGEVYNAGGGRHSNCSVREAIALCEEIVAKKVDITYSDQHRKGDHIWYISDTRKFQSHFPDWEYKFDLRRTLEEIGRSVANGTR